MAHRNYVPDPWPKGYIYTCALPTSAFTHRTHFSDIYLEHGQKQSFQTSKRCTLFRCCTSVPSFPIRYLWRRISYTSLKLSMNMIEFSDLEQLFTEQGNNVTSFLRAPHPEDGLSLFSPIDTPTKELLAEFQSPGSARLGEFSDPLPSSSKCLHNSPLSDLKEDSTPPGSSSGKQATPSPAWLKASSSTLTQSGSIPSTAYLPNGTVASILSKASDDFVQFTLGTTKANLAKLHSISEPPTAGSTSEFHHRTAASLENSPAPADATFAQTEVAQKRPPIAAPSSNLPVGTNPTTNHSLRKDDVAFLPVVNTAPKPALVNSHSLMGSPPSKTETGIPSPQPKNELLSHPTAQNTGVLSGSTKPNSEEMRPRKGNRLPGTSLGLPMPGNSKLSRRTRWELAAAYCLKFLSEAALKRVTSEVMSHVSPEVLSELATWASTLNEHEKQIDQADRSQSSSPTEQKKDGSKYRNNRLLAGENTVSEPAIAQTAIENGEQTLMEQQSLRQCNGPRAFHIQGRGPDVISNDQCISQGNASKGNLETACNSQNVLANCTKAQGKRKRQLPETQLPERFLQKWKQTIEEKEARERAAQARSKRKLKIVANVPPERANKKISLASKAAPVTKSMSPAAKYLARKHRDMKRKQSRKKEPSENIVPVNPKVPVPPPSSMPSRFCHLCTRTTKLEVVLVCRNVSKGTCRKVICFRCANEQRWDVSKLVGDDEWICTHCRQVCTANPTSI